MFGLDLQSGTYEVEDFALGDEVVQPVHDFFDRRGVVPPMHVEDVDVGRAEFLERGLNGEEHRFEVVPRVVDFLAEGGRFGAFEVGRVLHESEHIENLRGWCIAYLRSEDDLVAYTAGFHPFANEQLGCFILTTHSEHQLTSTLVDYSLAVGGIDEVPSRLVIRVEEFEGGLLVHIAHTDRMPLIADAHRSELNGGHMHACCGRELTINSELGRRSGGLDPESLDGLFRGRHGGDEEAMDPWMAGCEGLCRFTHARVSGSIGSYYTRS